MSTVFPLYANVELRAMTNRDLKRDSAVVISSTIPSAKYSCSGSSLMLSNGSTAIEGLSVSAMAGVDFAVWNDRGSGRQIGLMHRANKTKALSWQCFDETSLFTRIADHRSSRVQTSRQRRIRYDTSLPYRAHEVVLADDALPVSDQVIKQIENLWRSRDHFGPALQLAPVGVESV